MSSVHQCFLSAERNSYEINKYVADDVPRKVEYFLPTEVAVHNTEIDCWISYNDMVYDLTDLCKIWANKREIKPILAYAGKDISHWFDHEKNDIKYYVHPVTGVLVPYCPHGPIPDVCEEDSIRRIQERALIYNKNGKSYRWKFEGKDLTLDLTLTENGIPDERERFAACGLPDDYYIPCLMCYYNE
ncbi:cytochrome b5 domain-containing protein 1 [Frieseomelitta varia]|uniref:cytochrome b5 domain-containing protein 1 n=1 Tax=Frieseomelitta varia TaxID=561572 RepID=UPI001CB6A07A|nr:cytochrome b5 domain-containing protein 1 [Frieseomelitta varia]